MEVQEAPKKPIAITAYILEPPLNWPVWWYPHGDRKERPQAAQPVQCNDRGMIRLIVTAPNGTKRFVNACPWVGDPRLKFRSNRGDESGAWDFIPDLVPKRFVDMQPEEHTIIMLYRQHRNTIQEIVEYLGPPWKSQQVKAVLEKHRMLDDQQGSNP